MNPGIFYKDVRRFRVECSIYDGHMAKISECTLDGELVGYPVEITAFTIDPKTERLNGVNFKAPWLVESISSEPKGIYHETIESAIKTLEKHVEEMSGSLIPIEIKQL